MSLPDPAPLILLFLAVVAIARRNELVDLLGIAFHLCASPFVFGWHALTRLRAGLQLLAAATLAGLRYETAHLRTRAVPLNVWVGWDCVGPVVYLAGLLLIALPHLYITALRLEAMIGAETGTPVELPFSLGLLIGSVFIGLALIFGSALWDLYHPTPIIRPWANLDPVAQDRLRLLCWAGIGLVILAAVLFEAWGQIILSYPLTDHPVVIALPVIVMVLLGITMTVAVAIAGWSLFIAPGVIWAVTLLGVAASLRLLADLCAGVVLVLDHVGRFCYRAVDLLAALPRMLWNWICSFGFAQQLHLAPIVWRADPRITLDVEPAFGWAGSPSCSAEHDAEAQPRANGRLPVSAKPAAR